MLRILTGRAGTAPPRRRVRRSISALAVVLIGLLAAGAFAFTEAPAETRVGRRENPVVASGTTATDSAARRVWPSERRFRSVPGGEVRVAGAVWRIGDADDSVVLADWTCAGHETALVVTNRGGVFFFPRWAEAGEELAGDAIGHIPAGSRIQPAAECGEAMTTHPSGDHQPLRISR